MLPITLNVAGRLAVVIGGGPVGRRKADALLAAGARVLLVSLDARPARRTAAARPRHRPRLRVAPPTLRGVVRARLAGPPQRRRRRRRPGRTPHRNRVPGPRFGRSGIMSLPCSTASPCSVSAPP